MSVAAGALLGFTSAARATDHFWNVTTGDYNVAANWNPTSIPGAGDNAIVNNGGTASITVNDTSLALEAGTVANTSGFYLMSGGTFAATGNTMLGVATGSTGSLTISGGVFNNNSGTNQFSDLGNGGTGTLTVTGGSFNNGALNVADNSGSTGILNISGTGVVSLSFQGFGGVLYVGKNNLTTGTVNLGNGTAYDGTATTARLTVPQIIGSGATTGTSFFNFNGGLLQTLASISTGNASTFFGSVLLTRANVENGGAIFDTTNTGNFNVTVAQPLLHSNIAGDAAIDGGLTKRAGTTALILTGTNTYTGPTTITAGTLQIGNGTTGSILSSSAVTDNATLTLGRTDNTNFANTIGGTGGLAINGTGSLTATAVTLTTVSGTNNFAGNVAINGGSLVVTNSSALGTGTKTITATNNATNTNLRLDGTAGNVNLPSSFTYILSNYTAAINSATIYNVAGNNSIAGQFNLTSGGGSTAIESDAGTLNVSANIAAITSGRQLILQGASSGTVSGGISNGTYTSPTALPVVKNGTGTWTLSGTANTYTGGTTLNAGNFVFATGAVPATGAISINAGGALNLTGAFPTAASALTNANLATASTGALALTADSAENINFTGFNTLMLGSAVTTGAGATYTGTITPGTSGYHLGGGGGILTVPNVNALTGVNALTVGATSTTAGTGTGGVAGTSVGTVVLNAADNYTGATTVTVGNTLQVGDGTTDGSISGTTGVINNGTLRYNLLADQTLPYAITGTGTVTKTGPATLTLAPATNAAAILFVSNGTVALGTGAVFNQSAFDSVGLNGGDNGTLTLSGTAQDTVTGDFNVADLTNSTGTLNIGDTATLKVNTLYVGKGSATGTGAGTLGTVNQTGGTLSQNAAANEWRIGGGTINDTAAVGVYNLSGGTLTTPANFQVGAYGTGTFNQTGGTFTSSAYIDSGRFAGSSGNISVTGGTFNQTGTGTRLFAAESGTGIISVGGTGAINSTGGVVAGLNTGSSGTINLNTGGVLTTPTLFKGAGAGVVNFNGGTLRASANDNPTAATPVVFLTGVTSNVGNGGATVDTNGFTVTAASALVANGTGGLTKNSTGQLNLTANNTFTGATTINAGTLNIDNSTTTGTTTTAGNLSATSGVTINTGGTLLLSGATTFTNRLNDTAGVTLAGGAFNLNNRSEGAAGTTGVGALTLSATSTLDFGAPTATTSNLIQFGGVGAHTAGTTLAVADYDTGTVADHLYFAGTSTAFTGVFGQGDVSFNGVAGYTATDFGTYYEISGTAVPEPATWLAGALTVGMLGFAQRRRLTGWLGLQRTA